MTERNLAIVPRPAHGVDGSLVARSSIALTRDLLDRLNREAARRVVGRDRIVAAASSAWLDEHEGEQ